MIIQNKWRALLHIKQLIYIFCFQGEAGDAGAEGNPGPGVGHS